MCTRKQNLFCHSTIPAMCVGEFLRNGPSRQLIYSEVWENRDASRKSLSLSACILEGIAFGHKAEQGFRPVLDAVTRRMDEDDEKAFGTAYAVQE